MALELSVVKLPDGQLLKFEQDIPPPSGAYPVGIETEAGQIDFKSALDSVRIAAEELLKSLSNLVDPPKTCELNFGLKLSASAGFIVAKAQGEANFAVKMTWERKPAK